MITRLALGVLLVLVPTGASAHTLDEYFQASRLSLTRTDVGVDVDLTPGVQIAASIIALIDRDQNGVITPVEAADYGTRVLADIVVELHGKPVALTLTRVEVPPVGEMRDGMGTIRLRAAGAHRARLGRISVLRFRNDHAPGTSVYAVNAMLPADRALSVSRQERDVQQRSVKVVYDVRPALSLQLGWVIVAVLVVVGGMMSRRLPAMTFRRP